MSKPYKPRYYDAHGWAVDCLAGDVHVHCAECPACDYESSAASVEAAGEALFAHHAAVHLPNANYLAHTRAAQI